MRSGIVRERQVLHCMENLEHRAGIEPANTGFADQRVSHFAIGASLPPRTLKLQGTRRGNC